jgi:UDP-N-acetylglucosamine--N-acetylmuramyl-(pentapeptide) pyrophosphoryl-undecaprenol N-acetylglucosamine transferase
MTTYLLAGGGTAGHVNPMLAIADFLQTHEPECTIVMLGTAEGLEARLVPQAGFELVTIAKVPFPRRLNRSAVTFIPNWRRAVSDVKALIAERGVDVIVGVGGYAAAPAYAAARAMKIPFAIHEANARPGLANRLGARWTRFVGVAIGGTRIRHARLVGMPLRREFEHVATEFEKHTAQASFGLEPARPTIVVTGGSLGATRLNQATSEAAHELVRAGIQILHITGKRSASVMKDASTQSQKTAVETNKGYVLLEYCDRMRDALVCADVVVSRAGASTVCEIAALGLPAVFVPYPVGNGEQRFNALPLVNAGAAVLVPDVEFTAEWMREHIIPLVNDAARRQVMARAAGAIGIRDGAARMCALIEEARASTVVPNPLS